MQHPANAFCYTGSLSGIMQNNTVVGTSKQLQNATYQERMSRPRSSEGASSIGWSTACKHLGGFSLFGTCSWCSA